MKSPHQQARKTSSPPGLTGASANVLLNKPYGIGILLRQLLKIGAYGQVIGLLAGDPAANVSLGPDGQ